MNPFQPSFGKNPPTVIGREDIIEDFISGLEEGVGDERRATLFTGQRGMGKTVVLNQIAKQAKAKKWIVAEVTDNDTMLDDIYDQITDQMPKKPKRAVSGANISVLGIGAGVSTQGTSRREPGWRMRVTQALEELQAKNIGVLFTIDEIHSDSAELKLFATAYQHFVREERKVAVALAGLPGEVSEILQDKVLTFLRRATKVTLSNIELSLVIQGMLETIEENGRVITPYSLKYAAEATEGYPYLIQLIGSYIWRIHPDSREIPQADVEIGIPQAQAKMAENIIKPVLGALSDKDIAFLKAMSEDKEASKLSDIQERLSVTQSYASQYRKRLISAEVIYSPKRGYVSYAVPQMRSYFLGLI